MALRLYPPIRRAGAKRVLFEIARARSSRSLPGLRRDARALAPRTLDRPIPEEGAHQSELRAIWARPGHARDGEKERGYWTRRSEDGLLRSYSKQPDGSARTFFRPDGDPVEYYEQAARAVSTGRFLERFRVIAVARGWGSDTSPVELLKRWKAFVRSCEEGYRWSIYEYDNELSARDLLADVMNDSVLAQTPELAEWATRVALVDARFSALLHEHEMRGRDTDPWGRRGVLRSAGPEYRQDVRDLHGIESRRPTARSYEASKVSRSGRRPDGMVG